jgi:ribosomal protein L44E
MRLRQAKQQAQMQTDQRSLWRQAAGVTDCRTGYGTANRTGDQHFPLNLMKNSAHEKLLNRAKPYHGNALRLRCSACVALRRRKHRPALLQGRHTDLRWRKYR